MRESENGKGYPACFLVAVLYHQEAHEWLLLDEPVDADVSIDDTIIPYLIELNELLMPKDLKLGIVALDSLVLPLDDLAFAFKPKVPHQRVKKRVRMS